jgi:hypothetical protein
VQVILGKCEKVKLHVLEKPNIANTILSNIISWPMTKIRFAYPISYEKTSYQFYYDPKLRLS